MKKAILLITVILLGAGVYAQDENRNNPNEYKTLFGGDEVSNGGYGALSVNYSQIGGKDAVLVGARGAWVINHGMSIGIAGYGFANDLEYNKTINGFTDQYLMAGGYGGLLLEPIIGAKWPVHIAIPVLIGAGGVAYLNNTWHGYDDPYYHNDYYSEDADAFFVIEPGIEIELNMVKFMRLAIGGYYRFTSNLDLADTKSDVLNGFSTGITLKFGKF